MTIICIDIYKIKWFFTSKCFFNANFFQEGSRFLSPGLCQAELGWGGGEADIPSSAPVPTRYCTRV
jgi:hypothetical protein